MNEQRSADALAAWLAAGGATPPPDLDPEVVEAVVALRPDLAPAPRVRADDILASLTAGPLARGAAPVEAEVLPFPTRAARVEPASPTAAEPLPVALVEVVEDDEADGGDGGEPVDVSPIDAEVEAWEADPRHAADVVELEQRRFGRSRAWAIGSVGLAAAAAVALFVAGGERSPSAERVPVASVPASAPAPEPAVLEDVIPEVPLEEKPKATVADAKALAAAAKSATAALDALLAGPPPAAQVVAVADATVTSGLVGEAGAVGNTAGDAVAVADDDEAAEPSAPPEGGRGGVIGGGASLDRGGYGAGGGGAAPAASAPVAASAPELRGPSSKVIAEAEAPAKEEAKKAPSPAALAKARTLEAQIVAPTASGQKVAAQAAQAALDGGDPAYALVLIKKGFALGGEGTPERARLEALKATATQRLKGL
jgi:hypothetical protein